MSTTNKFIKNLSASNTAIKLARAKAVSEQTELEQNSLINDLKRKVSSLSMKIDQHCDLGPSQTTDLTAAGSKNFGPSQWVTTLQALKLELAEAKIELSIAEETYAEWFAPVEEEAPKAEA